MDSFPPDAKKEGYMDADTLDPENVCRKEGHRLMCSIHLEQKPYIVPLPYAHSGSLSVFVWLAKLKGPKTNKDKYEDWLTRSLDFEEDADEYVVQNIFFVPGNARWSRLSDTALCFALRVALTNRSRFRFCSIAVLIRCLSKR